MTPRDENRAHGIEGKLEEPDWPLLTLDEVDALLRDFPQAGEAKRLVSHSPRPFSSAAVVETAGETVFVKRHPLVVRDHEGLLEEHRLIAHLARAMRDEALLTDAPPLVQAVLANAVGETAIVRGEWTYEVHPLAAGRDVYEQALSWTPFLCVPHAQAAGRALARLHKAAEGHYAPARRVRPLVTSFTIFSGNGLGSYPTCEDRYSGDRYNNPVSRLQCYLEPRPLLRGYMEQRRWREAFLELLMPFFEKLEPWLPFLPPLWTHNDFHASNLMWSGDGIDAEVSAIVDFGLADRTNAVHDIATAIERNIIEWLRMDDPEVSQWHADQLDALLSGYEELSPMSYERRQALVAMLPLVHCEFALSETDYFLSVLHSEEKAYLGYEGYFLAHAEWFRSGQGRGLLEHLKRWAAMGGGTV